MIAFGPVPSRRLGRSLGVNNIPPKTCTYSCVYCQLGRTFKMRVDRRPFHEPEGILQDVQGKIEKVKRAGEPVDYLTFVADGEPTLDVNLSCEIALLEPLGLPIAVITNGSLIWREDVQEALLKADWVSLKVDAVEERTWRRMNRPHRALNLAAVLDGALAFGRAFAGTLVTETMLVGGINDDEGTLREVAEFLAHLRPAVAYLSVPTRPPAETWVHPPPDESILRAHQTLASVIGKVELLIGYEGDNFATTGDAQEDLLRITAVHPMREDAVDAFLARTGADWAMVGELVAEGLLMKVEYAGFAFYVRKFHKVCDEGRGGSDEPDGRCRGAGGGQ